MSSAGFGLGYYFKELLKTKTGLVGIVLLIILIILTIYSILVIPSSTYQAWVSGTGFLQNPSSAPPYWLSFFSPGNYFSSQTLNGNLNLVGMLPSGLNEFTYIYSLDYTFNWDNNLPPSNIYFNILFNTTISSISLTWIKPDLENITINLPTNLFVSPFDLTALKTSLSAYIESQTGSSLPYYTNQILAKVLFNKGGSNLLNNPVEKGTYKIQLLIISHSPLGLKDSRIILVGNSYGLMGTDFFGRPIDLGIMLGLPPALLIGFLTSFVSVFVGVFVGGLSGYMGGRKDDLIQWVTLVFLALPALPFLVAVAFVYKPDVYLESLLIALLSWPFYAIIARSTALSIKTQTFVEADRALGIPSRRIFLTHFFPRLIPFAAAYMALGIPAAIILSQTLAFIGIEPSGIITWGHILSEAESYQAAVNGWWWWIVFPGVAIVIVSLPFVLIGLALERLIFGGR